MATLISYISVCAARQNHGGRPLENRAQRDDVDPSSNKIKVMTLHASKGLGFSVVALPGVGHMPTPGEDGKEAGTGVLCGDHKGHAEVGDGCGRRWAAV
jgi:ATP-dependent exoDNAse (exonuclease V) beta subunit